MNRVRKQLESLSEQDYKEFNEKLIPGVKNILGVRLPKMREIAKAKAKEDAVGFLTEITEALCKNRETIYYEEIMVYGLVIGYAKFSDEERKYWLDRFRPYIDNWAVCDSCCMTYKWMKKNLKYWWDYLISCIMEDTEYSIRFAIVCMLAHFMDDEHIDQVLQWCGQICDKSVASRPYYIQMAVAWAVSVCYVKYPQKTHLFLEEDKMDSFTHNKSIQKICESFRVTKEQKAAVRELKRRL